MGRTSLPFVSLAWTPDARGRSGLGLVDFAAAAGEGITAGDAEAGLQQAARHTILLDGELGVAAAGRLEAALASEAADEAGAVRAVEPDGAQGEPLGGRRLQGGAEDDHAGERPQA